MQSNITHEQIAEAAGVSLATVSRVINGRAGVSARRAEQVRRVMDELDYNPVPLEERVAQASDRGRRGSAGGSIAVVVLDQSHQFAPNLFAMQMRGIQKGAADRGMNVIVAHANAADDLPPAVRSGQVEGLILLGSSPEPKLGRQLARLPRLWLNSHHEAGGDSVLAGNQRIGAIAADYLVDRGHERLGFLCVMADLPPYPTRLAAFRVQAAERGVEAPVQGFTRPMDAQTDRLNDPADALPMMKRDIDAAVDRWAQTPDRPTGLFVPNDLMTNLAYARLPHHGVVPGRDVLLISCNHEMTCLIGLNPRPATIDIGAESIGRRGVEQLLWRIQNPGDDRSAQIAVEPLLIEP
jgi:DNA-binding LacI/PurR family transcriptional regulator